MATSGHDSKQTGAERRRRDRLCPDLAAVEVNQPNVVRHFKVRLVEEEAGRHSDNVRCWSEKELRVEEKSGGKKKKKSSKRGFSSLPRGPFI